jgi:two-component system chemotaxis response regulator CheB
MVAMNQRSLQQGERIRVMVVDDSVVIRRLVTHALEHDPVIQVAGVAANGAIGLQQIPLLNPDVITLDIEMPEMNGLEMLRRVRQDFPLIRVIMFSTLTERGATITLEALTAGADDYVTKLSHGVSFEDSVSRLREELCPKVKQFFRFPAPGESARGCAIPTNPAPFAAGQFQLRQPSFNTQPKVVLIGVSTGGPAALGAILPNLPSDFPLPVLIVQHMPPLFTRLLADRLDAKCKIRVEEATDGALVEPGRMFVARGDFHMKVRGNGECRRISMDQSPQQNFCRPAVDALFTSCAEAYDGAVLAVVLTGMGQDGLRGAAILKARGARVLAQDEASSVVWGMPGAVVSAGLADRILPLGEVIPEILRITGEA